MRFLAVSLLFCLLNFFFFCVKKPEKKLKIFHRNWTIESPEKPRLEIYQKVCQDYRDILSETYKIIEIQSEEKFRFFNPKVTFCVGSGRKGLKMLTELAQNVSKMEPCQAQKLTQKSAKLPLYQPLEHPDYPGSFLAPLLFKEIVWILTLFTRVRPIF